MSRLNAFYPNGRPRSYCLICDGPIDTSTKGRRVIQLENYAHCELSSRALAVRHELGSRPPDAVVHGACYHSKLRPRQKELQSKAEAVPRTRAAVKALPRPPAPRAPAGVEQRLSELQAEAASITGALLPRQSLSGA